MNDLGMGTAPRCDFRIRSHGNDPVAQNGDGFRPGTGLVDGPNLGVGDHKIGGRRLGMTEGYKRQGREHESERPPRNRVMHKPSSWNRAETNVTLSDQR